MAVPHMAAEGQAVLNSIMTWAGRRIIHLGGCAHSLPQNLLTKDEERLRLDVIYEDPWILDTRKFIDIEKKRRYKLYARAMDYIRASKRHTRPLPFDLAHDLLAPTIKRPANAVLRNLTLKQYYRGGDCTAFYYCDCGKSKGSKNGNVDDGDDIEYGLGQVVLIMTCWTDGPSGYFRGNWTLEDDHGEWAGHRLDIVAPEVVNPDWEDVTAAAKEKLMRFRSQYQ
ncbi:hypothetical protein H4R19_001093 [Coemansia spiralis]|nr:hypothetical protein H4R19_001093 [Coemansia spiralis]